MIKQWLCWVLGLCLMGGLAGSEGLPNIVLILTDDQGWNNTQVPMIEGRSDSRSDFYLTPNIQRLAEGGMTFSQAYAPHPVCSPSRHAIQFGMTPAKLKKTTNRGANYPEFVESPAIPQVMKAAHPEYRAAHFGKWHMFGHPSDRGYDASDGRTNNQTGRQKTTDQTKYWAHEDPKRSVSMTDQAIQFVSHQVAAGNPFYLQLSHYFIHLSAEAKAATLEKHKQRSPGEVHTAYWYAAMLEDLDHEVGRILDVLAESGVLENTYIFFTSDNGGTARQFPHFNKPLRAGKGSYYEGGIRVPFFVMGPGIERGSYSTVPIVGYDLLPTFVDLIDSKHPLPPEIEGGSFKSVLFNGGNGEVPRADEGIYFSRQADAVLIQGDLKLKLLHATGEVELYDLGEDLSELSNLAGVKPAVATKMLQDLRAWMDDHDVTTPSPYAPPARRRR